MRAALESVLAREGPLDVLLDLREVERCALDSRHALLELQLGLKAAGRRTAYVAGRPRIRGLALWVIHRAGDERAKVVAKSAQAEAWLAHEGERQQQMTARCSSIHAELERRGGKGL